MKAFNKTSLYVLIAILIFQSMSIPVSAIASDRNEANDESSDLLFTELDEDVQIYENETGSSDVIGTLTNGDTIEILHSGEQFSLIEHTDQETLEQLEGYVLNEEIEALSYEDLEESTEVDEHVLEFDLTDLEEEIFVYENESESSEVVGTLTNEDTIRLLDSSDDFSFIEYLNIETLEEIQGYVLNEDILLILDEGQEESYEETPTEDNVEVDDETPNVDLDSDGSSDTAEEDQDENSVSTKEEQDDQIKENDSAENASLFSTASAQSLQGIALNNRTHVYSEPSTSSESKKSYAKGSILKYHDYSDNWYRTGVFIDGVKEVGYIHKSHVENAMEDPVLLEGVALKNRTPVYMRASTDSSIRKDYAPGSILKYYTFSENWYRTGVFVNGVKQTGYIHKSDVENPTDNPVLLEGIAITDRTPVYTNPSTNSSIRRDYAPGSILKYYTFTDEWYKTGVFIDGVKLTGYIHKSDVENPTDNPELLEGVALKNKTAVYSNPSTGSKKKKEYSSGSILKYYTYTDSWYRTGVYINGVKETGYIHKSDVDTATDNPVYKRGVALQQPTTVYSRASTNSKALKSYSSGRVLIYYTYSEDWYRTGVYIDGVKVTGYIHKSHVSESIESNYDLSLKEATDIQVRANGQTDKNYKTYVHKDYISNNRVIADTLNVRGGPGTDYWVVGQLKNNASVTILNTSGNWHEIEFTKNHQWVNASPQDISYYLDPNNFIDDPVQRFQFLDLSKASGASVASLNSYLADKGILRGHGQSFLNAGNTHNVNDAYLMSHALLETGNGSSQLATGNEVGLNSSGKATFVTSSNRGQLTSIKTVYNMYGVGANDGCALECGSIRAYQEGWTSPEKAIIGGAKFIGEQYIHGKNNTNTVQNTLYKMRWNPEYMERTNNAGHQYATDIGWASKQVSRISSIYADLGHDYILLDIPIYR